MGLPNPQTPFWSPDSQSIGFFADFQLTWINIASGTVQTLARTGVDGGTWNRDGAILFPTADGLFRVSATGDDVPSSVLLDTPGLPTFPSFLPDGQHFLFYIRGREGGVYLGQLGAAETRHLIDADARAVFLPPNTRLFVRSDWALAYYRQQRARGHSHHRALRALGAKWLKIIFAMQARHAPYDENSHVAMMARQQCRQVA